MVKENLLEKVKEAGFENMDDFVRANLNYLPERKQRLFSSIEDLRNLEYQGKDQLTKYSNKIT